MTLDLQTDRQKILNEETCPNMNVAKALEAVSQAVQRGAFAEVTHAYASRIQEWVCRAQSLQMK